VEGTRLRCAVPTDQIGELLRELGPYGITTLTCQPPTLEQLFLRHYDRNVAVAEPAPAPGARSS
jgi:ABC-2 type transport system ATP-binding protein